MFLGTGGTGQAVYSQDCQETAALSTAWPLVRTPLQVVFDDVDKPASTNDREWACNCVGKRRTHERVGVALVAINTTWQFKAKQVAKVHKAAFARIDKSSCWRRRCYCFGPFTANANRTFYDSW